MKRTPLGRKTALKTTKGLSTAKALKRGETPQARPRRDTGPSPATRSKVIERASICCERCGKSLTGQPYSIHHRKPRGMGGTSDPGANSPANLLLLCGSATTPDGCHTAVERFRASAIKTGFIVPRTADPSGVPVKMPSGWWLLGHDGSKTPTTRPEDTGTDQDVE